MSSQPRSTAKRAARLTLESLEDRTTPTFLPRPGQVITVNGVTQPAGGLSLAAGNVLPDPNAPAGEVSNEYVTGTGPGTEGLVRVWPSNGTTNGQGVPALTIDPFPGFKGGINVAVGDLFGDGHMDIIAAVAGNGPPHVKVFDPDGNELSSFYAFDPAFMGGVNITVGKVLGPIGAGGYPGGQSGTPSPYTQQIIIGAAAGDAPHVVVTDGSGTILRSFLAFDLGYRGGVVVAAANLDSTQTADFAISGTDTNAYDEIIVGAATDIPHVKAFDVWTGAIQQRLSFYAFDPSVHEGVTLAAGPTADTQDAQIFVSQITPPTSTASPTVRVFNGLGKFQLEFKPYPDGYTHVLNMTVAWFTEPAPTTSYYDPSSDDTGSNFDFHTQDLVMVAGDAAYFQQPRYFKGLPNSPANPNNPP